jgi:hypothetical protein
MKTRTSVGWMAVTAMAAVVSACGSSTSSDFADGGGRDAGTSSGGSSGSGSGGSASGSGSGSGGGLISGDASTGSSGDGGGNGAGCPIATIGVAGKYGQGDLFADWLSSQGQSASGNLGDQVLTAALLAPYKILVAQDVSMNHT